MAPDPESTRQRIFDAAIEEFAAHGNAGARVDRIAEKARANKESIYRKQYVSCNISGTAFQAACSIRSGVADYALAA